MTLLPEIVNSGIVFRRSDLENGKNDFGQLQNCYHHNLGFLIANELAVLKF